MQHDHQELLGDLTFVLREIARDHTHTPSDEALDALFADELADAGLCWAHLAAYVLTHGDERMATLLWIAEAPADVAALTIYTDYQAQSPADDLTGRTIIVFNDGSALAYIPKE